MNNNQIIIFKNDAVGDLTHSLPAINKIIANHKDCQIIIYLSEKSKNFNFLIKDKNVLFRTINYNLNFLDKFKLIKILFKTNISKIFILAPKNFYFFLPFFFRSIKFYAICVDNLDNYKRPSNFLRKYLTKYVINHRDATYKRNSTSSIQLKLVNHSNNNQVVNYNFKSSNNFLDNYMNKNYAYFHIKQKIISELKWSDKDLELLFSTILKHYENIFITRDIEETIKKKNYDFKYNLVDISKSDVLQNNSKIFIFDNIEGIDLFNVINNSRKIIAFHGMMTNLAALNKKKVLDLFFCKINNKKDYQSYRNSFYEFKPVYKDYDFTIPSSDINKTLKKMNYSLIK